MGFAASLVLHLTMRIEMTASHRSWSGTSPLLVNSETTQGLFLGSDGPTAFVMVLLSSISRLVFTIAFLPQILQL